MLIVPLHRAPTRANFPWVTLALILANVFVFAFLQSGDARIEEEALDYYAQARLAPIEFPAYREWLGLHAGNGEAQRRELFEALADSGDVRAPAHLLQTDMAFLADLRAGRVLSPQAPDYASWRAARDEFDRLWNSAFSERWMLHFSEFDPRRMFGAMFLHGGVGHLIGNMLFLALLGLLVEGALGPWLFLAVYLLGGFGSALFSLAWRWGEQGSALGASGAIASLMGAYCVLWGTRKVRFFWWFFVAFDYVKAPALVLLPFWLGWELVNLIWNKGAHVGFDAHAGGIVTGALLALAVRALRWERGDFLDEEVAADSVAADRAALERARQHLGRLEIAAARSLIEPIAARRPDDFEVGVALYRCARYEPGMPGLREAARRALVAATVDTAQTREQKAVFDEFRKLGGAQVPLSAQELVALARRWPAIGAGADSARLLVTILARAPATAGLAADALALAREVRARGADAKVLLEAIVGAYPQTREGDKARVLLSDMA